MEAETLQALDQFEQLLTGHPEIFGENSDLTMPWPTPYGWEPPKEWFQPDENYALGDSVIITPQGQFKAWSHDWETYHIGTTASGQTPWKAERSPTGNKAFHQGEVHTADGTIIEAGVVPIAGGHADPYASPQEALAHYDNPDYVRIAAVANETDEGCQINGFIMPGTTFDEVAKMRLMGLSGDWRWFPQLASLDYIGPCFVPRQGLPKGMERASVTASVQLQTDALFTDSKMFKGTVNEQGQLVSVTASAVNTVTIKPVTLQERYNRPEKAVTAADTAPQAAQAVSGQTVELESKVDANSQDIAQLYELVYTLQAAAEDVNEIDQVTPDS